LGPEGFEPSTNGLRDSGFSEQNQQDRPKSVPQYLLKRGPEREDWRGSENFCGTVFRRLTDRLEPRE
jgi:hypothetical protein